MTTRALIPDRFNLVDEDGNAARAMVCPFCRGQLTIGFVARPDGERDTSPAAIHGTITGGATGCETFDRLELVPFLEVALPILTRRAVLELVSGARRRGLPS